MRWGLGSAARRLRVARGAAAPSSGTRACLLVVADAAKPSVAAARLRPSLHCRFSCCRGDAQAYTVERNEPAQLIERQEGWPPPLRRATRRRDTSRRPPSRLPRRRRRGHQEQAVGVAAAAAVDQVAAVGGARGVGREAAQRGRQAQRRRLPAPVGRQAQLPAALGKKLQDRGGAEESAAVGVPKCSGRRRTSVAVQRLPCHGRKRMQLRRAPTAPNYPP